MRARLLVLLAAACSPDLPKQSIVSKLRVLAVRAEPAELIVGASTAVSLTALAVDPSGAPIEMRWALCPLPADLPPPATLACPGPLGIDLPAARLDLADASTHPLWQVLYTTPDGTPLTQAQRTSLMAAGTTVVVGFSARAGGEALDGFAEVPLRQSAAPINHNPGMQALLADGAELPADGSGVLHAGVKVRLKPVPAADAKEVTGSGLEALTFSFFATDGDVSSLRSTDQTATGESADPSIDYTAPSTAGTVHFWIVVRDGRGGVGWLERTARVIAG